MTQDQQINWQGLCQELLQLDTEQPTEYADWKQRWNAAIKRARAALAAEPVGKRPTDEEIERRFQVWWYDEGSGMPPGADEDPEAHVHRISQIAWHNGAYVARYGHQPAPPAAGEVGELARQLGVIAADAEAADFVSDATKLTRAAALLEQRHPTPVPVSERLPGPGDCDALGYCWWWDPFRRESWEYCITGGGPDWYWLPFTALPLPQGR